MGFVSLQAGDPEAAPETAGPAAPAPAPAREDDEAGASPLAHFHCRNLPVVVGNGGMGLVGKTSQQIGNNRL